MILSPSVIRLIEDKRFPLPFGDIFAAMSSVIGRRQIFSHGPISGGGQLRFKDPSDENRDSMSAKASLPSSVTCTVYPKQDFNSLSVIIYWI